LGVRRQGQRRRQQQRRTPGSSVSHAADSMDEGRVTTRDSFDRSAFEHVRDPGTNAFFQVRCMREAQCYDLNTHGQGNL
jgi:hypothetical protein